MADPAEQKPMDGRFELYTNCYKRKPLCVSIFWYHICHTGSHWHCLIPHPTSYWPLLYKLLCCITYGICDTCCGILVVFYRHYILHVKCFTCYRIYINVTCKYEKSCAMCCVLSVLHTLSHPRYDSGDKIQDVGFHIHLNSPPR